MIKKYVLFLLMLFLSINTVCAKDVIKYNPKADMYNLGISYDEAVQQNKPIVLLFYTNWCSACKTFLPMFKAQQQKFGDSYIFTTLNAEDENHAVTIKSYYIRCYPTVYIVDNKYDNRVHIEVSYLFNSEAFSNELKRYLKIRKLLDSKK